MDIKVYVDGTYRNNQQAGGYVVLQDDKPTLARRIIIENEKFSKHNNVTGELYATLFAILDVINCYKDSDIVLNSITVFHDYNGISKFANGEWMPNTTLTKRYAIMIHSMREAFKDLDIRFSKVKAHSGDFWNTIADELAMGRVPMAVRDVIQEPGVLTE